MRVTLRSYLGRPFWRLGRRLIGRDGRGQTLRSRIGGELYKFGDHISGQRPWGV